MSLIKNALYGLTFSLGLVTAAFADTQPATAPSHAGWKDHFDPVRMAQHHLEKLKSRLGLTDNQHDAWKGFADSVMTQAKDMADVHRKMMQNHEQLTAPERMHQMADAMAIRANGMKTVAESAKTLYGQLSPQQQAVFNEMAGAHHRRMMHNMPHQNMNMPAGAPAPAPAPAP